MRGSGIVLLLASLAFTPLGCNIGFGGADDDIADDDTATPDDDIGDDDDFTPSGSVIVSSVSPPSGILDGGYPVTIFGSNFTTSADTTVYFGVGVAAVTSCSTGQCTVNVPPGTEEGPVTVTVANSNGTGVKEEAFTYEEDISDLYTYALEITRFEYVYPDAYEEPWPENTVSSIAYFFTPMELQAYTQLSWGNLLPAPGSCVTWVYPTDLQSTSISPYDAGASVTLANGGASLTLTQTQHYYSTSTTDMGAYSAGAYTLNISGGADLFSESIPAALVAPAVVHTQPPMDPGTISPSQMSSGLDVSIQGNCSSAVVNVNVHDDTGAYTESVLCHFNNGQNMTVPGSYLGAYTNALGLVVEAECYSTTETVAASGAKVIGIGRSIASGIMYVQ